VLLTISIYTKSFIPLFLLKENKNSHKKLYFITKYNLYKHFVSPYDMCVWKYFISLNHMKKMLSFFSIFFLAN